MMRAIFVEVLRLSGNASSEETEGAYSFDNADQTAGPVVSMICAEVG